MTRIRIVRLHGKRLPWWTMFLREFIRKAFSGCILFIDFLMALGKEKRALHDYIAGMQSFDRKLPTQEEAMKINLTESTYRTEMRVQERYSKALVCKNGSRKPGI